MREWTFYDKSKWPERGPWDLEPDKVQWKDEVTGLTCLAVRLHSNWCGYVGVPEGHPWFGKDMSSCDDDSIQYPDVHGGVTFSGSCQEDREHGICHIPESGESDHVWWIGFDCAHAWDKRPAADLRSYEIEQQFPDVNEQYRTLDYVKAECANLARQASEAAQKGLNLKWNGV